MMRAEAVSYRAERPGLVRMRGWGCVGLTLLLVGVPFLLQVVCFRPRSNLMTVGDVRDLKDAALAKPESADRATELAIGYAALLGQFGDLDKGYRATSALVDENPSFGQAPKVQESKRKMDEAMVRVRARFGIASDDEFQTLLNQGLTDTTAALARTDLSSSQRATVHLARGRLWLQKNQPAKALEDARGATQAKGDPVSIHLLRGDAQVDREKWSEAIKEYRAASLALTSWANREPGWEVKLMWGMRRGRSWRYERRWRDRRQEIAANVRFVIADQIRVLQGLERLDEKVGKRDKSLE